MSSATLKQIKYKFFLGTERCGVAASTEIIKAKRDMRNSGRVLERVRTPSLISYLERGGGRGSYPVVALG